MRIIITCFSLRVFMKTASFCSLFNWDLDSPLDLTLCNATLTHWHFMHCIYVHVNVNICILITVTYLCVYVYVCYVFFSILIDTLLLLMFWKEYMG